MRKWGVSRHVLGLWPFKEVAQLREVNGFERSDVKFMYCMTGKAGGDSVSVIASSLPSPRRAMSEGHGRVMWLAGPPPSLSRIADAINPDASSIIKYFPPG